MTGSFLPDTGLKMKDLAMIVPVALTIITFIIYWFIADSQKLRSLFYERYDDDTASTYHILLSKVMGFIIMGVVPMAICLLVIPDYSLKDYGLALRPETRPETILWILILSPVVMVLTFLGANKPLNLLSYPQIRAKIWKPVTILIAVTGWALYLLGYETLFRGILLFPVADNLGIWPAVTINTALYSATHIPKGINEAVGAIPLGIVLCLLTLGTGTIWIAFFVHLFMALTNCFASLKYNPDMIFQVKSR